MRIVMGITVHSHFGVEKEIAVRTSSVQKIDKLLSDGLRILFIESHSCHGKNLRSPKVHTIDEMDIRIAERPRQSLIACQ